MKSNTILVHMRPLIAGLALISVLSVAGCGSSGGPDPQTQAKNVENAKTMRSYYDKVNGDYAQLSETDKAEYVKLAGGEDKAQQNWNLMKNGPGAVDRSGNPPPSGQ